MAPSIPLPYTIFFLWIEPIFTLAGAFLAWFQPATYLALTHAASAPQKLVGLPIATLVSLLQLGNLYLAFAVIEASVLRATTDLNVWRALLISLLIADFGHLLSCYPLGLDLYYDVRKWTAIAYGSYLFVYIGASFRISFLLNIGFQGPKRGKRTARKSIKAARQDELLATPTPTVAQLSRTPAQSTRRRKSKATSSS
ncbi:hypothetical protein DV736_g6299, partial [Chaetothyriales sp. CBS 134916]